MQAWFPKLRPVAKLVAVARVWLRVRTNRVQKVGTRRPNAICTINYCGSIYENEPSCYKCDCGGLKLPCWLGGEDPYWEISPRMSHRSTNRFNQREVARALRAARLAGERPERVEIDPVTGRITVIIAQAGDGEREKAAGTRAWDDAIVAIEKSKKPDKATVKRR